MDVRPSRRLTRAVVPFTAARHTAKRIREDTAFSTVMDPHPARRISWKTETASPGSWGTTMSAVSKTIIICSSFPAPAGGPGGSWTGYHIFPGLERDFSYRTAAGSKRKNMDKVEPKFLLGLTKIL